MIRVNVVPVTELCDQHVVSEHKSICTIITKLALGKMHYECDRPDALHFGVGHSRFWTNKLRFLYLRHEALCSEAMARGLTLEARCHAGNPSTRYWNDYRPSRSDIYLNRQHLKEVISKRARWTEYVQPANM